ncbi:MAG: dephospho-CoA kinase [Sporomusaceae bacterium]|nr:dephospho-CoA kinase [Sporomusaceae bacterium]
MHLIGLTGGIACGKSTVAALLAAKGACLIDADKIARQVVEPNTPAFHGILHFFGSAVLGADGAIDRQQLAREIFASEDKRKQLDAITHPPILAEIQRKIQAAATMGISLVILDVPLLFESGWHKKMDEVWVVTIQDPSVQLQRLMDRNGFSKEDARARMAAQWSQSEKVRLADQVIDNSGDLASLNRQVEALWEQAQERALLKQTVLLAKDKLKL